MSTSRSGSDVVPARAESAHDSAPATHVPGRRRPMPSRRRQVQGLGAFVGLLACLLLVLQLVTSGSPGHPRPTTASGLPWLSGASGKQAADGSYAAWRGRPLDIVGTWADSPAASTALWQLQPGAEFSSTAWHGDIDLAVGAIGAGESWSAAASGAYDARWERSLTNIKSAWGSRPGTVFLRFAHEMNGNWYPWAVDASSAGDFDTAWRRYRALQRRTMPAAKLVFSVNRESSGMGMDWRKVFPGRDQVDVMSVDYYNQYPFVGTAEEWSQSINQSDRFGAPKGLATHLAFAKSLGLPLAVSEWSNNSDMGDSPAFLQGIHSFFRAQAGSGPGKVLYEIQFDVDQDANRWTLFPTTRSPAAAAAYRSLW